MGVTYVAVQKITLVRRHFAQSTAGNFKTEHAQYVRRGNVPNLNGTRPIRIRRACAGQLYATPPQVFVVSA